MRPYTYCTPTTLLGGYTGMARFKRVNSLFRKSTQQQFSDKYTLEHKSIA